MNANTTEKFEAYLEDKLSAEERDAFERQLAEDKALNDAFEAHKAARELILRVGQMRSFQKQIKTELEAEGFFDAYRTPETAPTPNTVPGQQNRWTTWQAIAATVLLLLTGFLFYQQVELQKKIARIESHLALQDSLSAIQNLEKYNAVQDAEIAGIKRELQQQNEQMEIHWNRVDSALIKQGYQLADINGCMLTPEERKRWYNNFTQEETDALKAAGNVPSVKKTWQDYLSAKNDSEVIRILRQQAETAPQSLNRVEYYILGTMCLLNEQNASEAVWYLEKAKGVMRPAHKKMLLAAYLENDQLKKARNWVRDQKILPNQWPLRAAPCLNE